MQNQERFRRFSALIGEEGFLKIKNSKIAIFGIGGVGSYAAEALARSGVGHLILVDFDTVAASNINRQIHALDSTVGKEKAKVMRERIGFINPDCTVEIYSEKVTPENAVDFLPVDLTFVADCIDDVPAKTALIAGCMNTGIPLISAMGTGNKLHPELLEIADLSKTEVCPLCRSMRRKLKDIGITKGVNVVFSREIPVKSPLADGNKPIPASSAFVPGAAGLMIASFIVNSLLEIKE